MLSQAGEQTCVGRRFPKPSGILILKIDERLLDCIVVLKRIQEVRRKRAECRVLASLLNLIRPPTNPQSDSGSAGILASACSGGIAGKDAGAPRFMKSHHGSRSAHGNFELSTLQPSLQAAADRGESIQQPAVSVPRGRFLERAVQSNLDLTIGGQTPA